MVSNSQFNRQMRAAQRDFERQFKREVEKASRTFEREVNREIDKANRSNKRIVDAHNRKADAHNRKVIADLNKQLRASSPSVTYRPAEEALVERVHGAINFDDGVEYDVFISYARIDGETTATALADALRERGVTPWLDQVAIEPGKSQSLQMDAGLRRAAAGIAVLTPAYLTGRFWTQRELGALLHKDVLIPVLDGVTFADVAEYSGILPDLAGFTTAEDDIETIADKIAPAVLPAAAS
ncbi:hypothetical protein ASF38_07105 [Aeromicrobium sp. Leaf272]|nr:hypothetical protein ASF38_07105 [Aeromicrobium sp. Leaf272]